MSRNSLFACFMCFATGACMSTLMIYLFARRPPREMAAGLALYLILALALAYKLGGAILL